jgi:hypothetical protein
MNLNCLVLVITTGTISKNLNKLKMRALKIAIASIMLLVMFKSNAQPARAVFTLKDFKICWQLKDMVYQSNGGSYDSLAVKKIVGNIFCFNSEMSNILGDTIIHAKYSLKKESTTKYIVRNFQVFENIYKWFKIKEDSLYVIKLASGISLTKDSKVKIKRIKAYPYEFAYDGEFLYLPSNGGFFRFTRYQPEIPKNMGHGSTIKQFTLSGKESSIDISFEFFTDPDELSVFDQDGNELFRSGIMNTDKVINQTINLKNVTKLVFKIDSKASNSRWSFWFNAK